MFNITICSGLASFWRWEGIFIFISIIFFFFFNAAFISFSFLCCEFPVTLSCLCLGWWPKEPAGLKTLRLVSMPSWRHANSEEQEEEDDDDVVGPPWVAASRLALQGHQRVRGSLGLQQLSYNHLLPHPPGIFGSQRKWLKLIVPHATVR